MGERNSKRTRRQVRKLSKEIIKQALSDLRRYPFLERIKFAFFIIRGQK